MDNSKIQEILEEKPPWGQLDKFVMRMAMYDVILDYGFARWAHSLCFFVQPTDMLWVFSVTRGKRNFLVYATSTKSLWAGIMAHDGRDV